jgi:hypothetical protein
LLLLVLMLLSLGAVAPAAAQIIINEFMASNREAVQDPQRDYDDWVELYNPDRLAVDVGGMYLSDDPCTPAKWQFPLDQPDVTTIAPRGYLLIWADGDVTASGLHAGFRLNADGEQILLVDSDGATVIDSIEFDEQFADVSYGRYPDGDPNLRYMAAPTPGATNSDTYEGIAADPQFSLTGCLCTEPVTVTLSTETPGATIYYTLNGQTPFSEVRERAGGFVYAGPISISATTTIKAITWLPGWRQSRVRTERYTFVDSDVRRFSSSVPIAVVDTMGKSVSSSQVPAYSYFIDTVQGTASMTNQPDFAGYSALNVRGKSSEGFAKKQYHLEIWDEDDRDTDASILGMPPDSDWVLQGPYSDKSLMRNVLAYRWSNEIGQYAPRTRFIELFLTADSTVSMRDYVGVYVLMEKIKIAPGRVDITELGPLDNAEPEITGGYIVKKDKYDGGDQTFRTSTGQSLIYDDPIGPDLTEQQKDWIGNFFDTFESVLYGPNFQDPTTGYAAFIDEASFIEHHIIVELCKNIDGFRLSTYMYKDRNGKLHMGPVWDYNLSLGNANYLQGWIPSGWYYQQLGDGEYPWWRRLFEDPQFRLHYADRWFAVRRDLFTTDRLLGMVDDYAALLEEPQARNFDRWSILGRYVWPNWYVADTFQQEIDWMKGWLADRLTWMDAQIGNEFAPPPPTFNKQGGQVETGFALEIAAPAGSIYYTVNGLDPRAIDPTTTPTLGTPLITEDAPKRVLVPTGPVDDAWRGGEDFDDSAWTAVTGSPGGVGYETSSGYERLFTLDVGALMFGQRTTCYIRVPFDLAERPDRYEMATLHIRYDDGFVAYLNGTEIARRNIHGTPAWNAQADDQHLDVDAESLEVILVPDIADLLRRSDNVLAIHGLNVSSTSSDFLISVELIGVLAPENDDDAAPDVAEYLSPIVLTRSTRVRARARSGSTWTAINDAVFTVGPVAESLRISELMYHPVDTGNPEDPNSEYIELLNIGAETINLNLVSFTAGIDFTFGAVELVPGDRTLLVRDLTAFEATYGPGLPVAGQYAGSLNNAGERIELRDAAGQVIHDFTYRDDWYDTTDGDGFSLTVIDPVTTAPDAWSSEATWGPSPELGGSPGL